MLSWRTSLVHSIHERKTHIFGYTVSILFPVTVDTMVSKAPFLQWIFGRTTRNRNTFEVGNQNHPMSVCRLLQVTVRRRRELRLTTTGGPDHAKSRRSLVQPSCGSSTKHPLPCWEEVSYICLRQKLASLTFINPLFEVLVFTYQTDLNRLRL